MENKKSNNASIAYALAFIAVSIAGVIFISKKGYSAWLYVLLFLVVAPLFSSVLYMIFAPSNSEDKTLATTIDKPVAVVETTASTATTA